MSVRASSIPVVVLALALTCFAQLNHSRMDAMDGSITGVVRTLDGHAVSDARVEVRDPQNGSTVASGFSDERGAFTISSIPEGTYEVVAQKGVNEARDRATISGLDSQVTLRMNYSQTASDGSSTVSVASMRIPEKARKEYAKGDEAMKKNKLDDARKHIDNALSICPEYAEALTLRGILEMDKQAHDAAIADFDHAIKADPNYSLAYMALGASYNQLSKFEEAARTLNRAVTLDPSAWQAYFELAKASLGKGDYQGALKFISRAAQISQEFAPIHLVRAHALLGLKMYQDAVTELEAFLTRDPNGANSAAARQTLDMAKAFASRAAR